jgi:hypothetical protein
MGIGVYGRCSNVKPDVAGYFDGDVQVNGITSGVGILTVSDQMFKTNVDSIPNALGKIHQLHPKTFYLDTTNNFGMRFPSARQYGLIAQQVQTVLPELVASRLRPAMLDSLGSVVTPSTSYLTVDYTALTGIMIRAIQQLSDKIDLQNAEIQSLKECTGCGNTPGGGMGQSVIPPNAQIGVVLTNNEVIVLNQSEPNPMKEHCRITYDIPLDFKTAQIVFKTVDGRIIKVVDVTQKGSGQLNVYAADLSNGIYSYYMSVDGIVVGSRKLIKED